MNTFYNFVSIKKAFEGSSSMFEHTFLRQIGLENVNIRLFAMTWMCFCRKKISFAANNKHAYHYETRRNDKNGRDDCSADCNYRD